MIKKIFLMVGFFFALLPFHTFLFAGEAEKVLVAECMATSGGQPAVFAGCAIKGLAFNEIKNCLIGDQIGTTCFGEGNTLRRWNNWFNRAILGNCGFRAITAKKPQFMVFNSTNVPVDVAVEFPDGPGDHARIESGFSVTWTLNWCDQWVNLDTPGGENFGWDAGSVVELAIGEDGKMHQFSVTPPK